MRVGVLSLVLVGCAVEKAPTSSVSFLAPEPGEQVVVGDVPVTLLVERFGLVPEALQHNEGQPEGQVVLWVDGVEVLRTAETNVTVPVERLGDVTLRAELVYADGDPLDPPATAAVTVLSVAP